VVSDTGVPEAVDPVIPEDPVEAVVSVVEPVDPALAPLSEPTVEAVAPSAEVSG